MPYNMLPKGNTMWDSMDKDVLFNKWWSYVSMDEQLPSTKKIAYGAWQAGIRHFIDTIKPIAYWESSEASNNHVTFDIDLAYSWKNHYNMAVEPLFILPSTEIKAEISKDCNDD